MNKKVCNTCKEEKLITEFVKKDRLRYTTKCKVCYNEKRRMYNRMYNSLSMEDKIKLKEEVRIREENRRLQRERKKAEILIKKIEYKKLKEYWKTDEWKKIKKQQDSKKQYDNWKRRWKTDELFSTKVRIRNLVRNTFRKSGYTKPSEGTEKILGCSFDELKLHLESKFVDGMNWENRGKWHIDHIIPLSSANTKEDLIRLSHYSNLQPLWAEDNINKGDKIL